MFHGNKLRVVFGVAAVTGFGIVQCFDCRPIAVRHLPPWPCVRLTRLAEEAVSTSAGGQHPSLRGGLNDPPCRRISIRSARGNLTSTGYNVTYRDPRDRF